MIVAHVCQTPVAGAAWAWARAFEEAGHDSFSVAGRGYGDGRSYPADEGWPPDERAIHRIRAADVIFCHQGHPYRHPWYPKRKPTVVIYHSAARDVCRVGERGRWPWAVVGQYQARLYPGCWPVPNLIPLNHPWYRVGDKPTDRVRIAYSPSNMGKTGWDDKGYAPTVEALRGVEAEVDVITGAGLEECLSRKSTAHIVIDECATGGYHRSSLEGLAQGSVVVNNADVFCWANVRRMAGGCNPPFITTDLTYLAETLRSLVDKGPSWLASQGVANRRWTEGAWSPGELIDRNFKPLIEAALLRAG